MPAVVSALRCPLPAPLAPRPGAARPATVLSGSWPALTSANPGRRSEGRRERQGICPTSLPVLCADCAPLGASPGSQSLHTVLSPVSVCVSFSSLTPQAWEVVTKSPNVPALGLGTFPVVPLEPSRTFVHNLFMELFSNPHLACALCPLLGSR